MEQWVSDCRAYSSDIERSEGRKFAANPTAQC